MRKRNQNAAQFAVVVGSLLATCSDAFLAPAGWIARKSLYPPLRDSGGDSLGDGFLDALSPKFNGDSQNEGRDVEPDSQGGSRFKEIIKRAQDRQDLISQNRPIDNPFLNQPIPPAAPQQPTGAPDMGSLDNLSVEDQAKLFRSLMQQNAAGIHAAPVPYQAPPPTKQDPRGGRPVGRNRDADAIANKADVYFAQLKQDSRVRTVARMRGDNATADAVFEDDAIKEIGNLLKENPHLQEKADKDRKFLDVDPDLVQSQLLKPFLEGSQEEENLKSYSGVSYKEKLKAKRAVKKVFGSTVKAPEDEISQTASASEQDKMAKDGQQVPDEDRTNPDIWTRQPVQKVSKPGDSSDRSAGGEQVVPAKVSSEQPHLSSPLVEGSPEETRVKLRTLMGLLLKHRGGPGFGAGVLKGAETRRFEDLYGEIAAVLKDEAVQASPNKELLTPATESSPPVQPIEEKVAETKVAEIQEKVPQAEVNAPETKKPVQNDVVPSTPQASAPTVTQNQDGNPPEAPIEDSKVAAMIACVEGAISMYKKSPPEIREGVLVSLRSALLSSVNTCNKIIAENELANFRAYQEATGTTGTPPPPVTQFYEVSPSGEAVGGKVVTPPAPSGDGEVVETSKVKIPLDGADFNATTDTDENTKLLERVYNNIKATAGDGKYGLKNDLSPSTASSSLEEIVAMRSILMDELDNGIPEPISKPAAKPEPVAKDEIPEPIAKNEVSNSSGKATVGQRITMTERPLSKESFSDKVPTSTEEEIAASSPGPVIRYEQMLARARAEAKARAEAEMKRNQGMGVHIPDMSYDDVSEEDEP